MAIKLIIGDFFGSGRPLKETVVSASMDQHRMKSSEVVVTRNLDKNTSKFIEMALDGTNIPSIILEYTTMEKKVLKTYMTYEFSNSMVSSYQISGTHGGQEEPVIVLVFNYQKMKADGE